jgi:hypothetical protein
LSTYLNFQIPAILRLELVQRPSKQRAAPRTPGDPPEHPPPRKECAAHRHRQLTPLTPYGPHPRPPQNNKSQEIRLAALSRHARPAAYQKRVSPRGEEDSAWLPVTLARAGARAERESRAFPCFLWYPITRRRSAPVTRCCWRAAAAVGLWLTDTPVRICQMPAPLLPSTHMFCPPAPPRLTGVGGAAGRTACCAPAAAASFGALTRQGLARVPLFKFPGQQQELHEFCQLWGSSWTFWCTLRRRPTRS